MEQAKSGDKVKVHYIHRFTNGRVFDSSINHPLAGQDLTFDLELVEIADSPD